MVTGLPWKSLTPPSPVLHPSPPLPSLLSSLPQLHFSSISRVYFELGSSAKHRCGEKTSASSNLVSSYLTSPRSVSRLPTDHLPGHQGGARWAVDTEFAIWMLVGKMQQTCQRLRTEPSLKCQTSFWELLELLLMVRVIAVVARIRDTGRKRVVGRLNV